MPYHLSLIICQEPQLEKNILLPCYIQCDFLVRFLKLWGSGNIKCLKWTKTLVRVKWSFRGFLGLYYQCHIRFHTTTHTQTHLYNYYVHTIYSLWMNFQLLVWVVSGDSFLCFFGLLGCFCFFFSYDDHEIDGRFWILVAMSLFELKKDIYEFFFLCLFLVFSSMSIKQSFRFQLVMVVLIWTWGHLGGYN